MHTDLKKIVYNHKRNGYLHRKCQGLYLKDSRNKKKIDQDNNIQDQYTKLIIFLLLTNNDQLKAEIKITFKLLPELATLGPKSNVVCEGFVCWKLHRTDKRKRIYK